MEQLLLNLDVANLDPEDLAAIFRAAHSIKGGAATFDFTALTETTHILESLLDRAQKRTHTASRHDRHVLRDQGRVLGPARCVSRERRARCAVRRANLRAARAPQRTARLKPRRRRWPWPPPVAPPMPAATAFEEALFDGPNAPPAHVVRQAMEAIEDDGCWDGVFELTDGIMNAGTAVPEMPGDIGARTADVGSHLKITLRGARRTWRL